MTDPCPLDGSQSGGQSGVGVGDSTDTADVAYLSPAGMERSKVKARSPLPRSGRRSQLGLRLSSSLNDLSDMGSCIALCNCGIRFTLFHRMSGTVEFLVYQIYHLIM